MAVLKGEKDIEVKTVQGGSLGYLVKDNVMGDFDANGNEVIKKASVASAINEITVTNAAISTGPSIAATGGDTNIPITLKGKGTGAVIVGQATSTDVRLAADQPIGDSSGNELIAFTKVASAVNEVNVSNNSTGLGPVLKATGETNVPITIAGKGTGPVNLGQSTTTGVVLLADQPINDSSGNELIKFTKVASAVNEITVSNNSTGVGPIISATGETNVPLTVAAKGTGALNLGQATGSIAAVARITTTDGISAGTAKVVGGRAYIKTDSTDAVTAATSNGSPVDFASTYSIPANTLGLGSLTKIRGSVAVTNDSGSDTLIITVYIGGTTLMATTAFDPSAATDFVYFEFDLISRAAAGATAAHVGRGHWVTSDNGTLVHGAAILASTNLATNGALVVKASATWSSNTASTSCNLETLDVEII